MFTRALRYRLLEGEPNDPGAPADPPATPPADPPADPVTYDIKFEDGVKVDETRLQALKDLAQANGWSNETTQAVANLGADMVKATKQAHADQVSRWTEDAKADKEFGGEAFDANLATANKALDTIATKEFSDFLKTSGLSNHPEMIRAMLKVAKLTNEDTLVTGAPTSGDATALEKRMYPSMNK